MNFNIFKRRVVKEVLLGFIDFSDAQIKCQWFVVMDCAKSPCLLKQPLTAERRENRTQRAIKALASLNSAFFVLPRRRSLVDSKRSLKINSLTVDG